MCEIENAEGERLLSKEWQSLFTTTDYALPVVIKPKKDGTLRLCVDNRRLDAIRILYMYTIPMMYGFIDSLEDAEIFSTLGANSGYW